MNYTLENGKVVRIPDAEIANNMELLDISREEAIQMWLEDRPASRRWDSRPMTTSPPRKSCSAT